MSIQVNELPIAQMIEATLEQLLEWRRTVTVDQSLDVHSYGQVLIAYLKGDEVDLEMKRITAKPGSVVSEIALMRAKVLRQNLSVEVISSFADRMLKLAQDDVWLGESLFIAGYASYTIREYSDAIGYYERAVSLLRKSGAFKKALKCQQNILASKTCLQPGLKCIPEYQEIYREARRIRDFATCGLTLMNMSREYQKLGALNVALDTINLALTYYQKDFGTMDYYLALVHRAHLFIQIGDQERSLRDIEACLASDFPAVRDAVSVLERIDLQTEVAVSAVVSEQALNPTWAKRLKEFRNEKNSALFSGLEEKLLALLRTGNCTRHELAEKLYGNLIDSEAAENRLKNLLARIRKKSPGLIESRDGRYWIRDAEKRIG